MVARARSFDPPETDFTREMKKKRHSVRWILTTVLALSLPAIAFCQEGEHAPPQGHRGDHKGAMPGAQGRHGQFRPGPKAGEWLRKYHRLPPQEQEKALANDPEFRQLPPEHQEKLLERLRRFNQLPPEQRERILNRMEQFDRMSPEQRQQWQRFQGVLNQLPPERRQALHQAFRHLRMMPPEERARVLESDRFKQNFGPREQELLRGMLEAEPPEEF